MNDLEEVNQLQNNELIDLNEDVEAVETNLQIEIDALEYDLDTMETKMNGWIIFLIIWKLYFSRTSTKIINKYGNCLPYNKQLDVSCVDGQPTKRHMF